MRGGYAEMKGDKSFLASEKHRGAYSVLSKFQRTRGKQNIASLLIMTWIDLPHNGHSSNYLQELYTNITVHNLYSYLMRHNTLLGPIVFYIIERKKWCMSGKIKFPKSYY